jgi:hypothetical protein
VAVVLSIFQAGHEGPIPFARSYCSGPGQGHDHLDQVSSQDAVADAVPVAAPSRAPPRPAPAGAWRTRCPRRIIALCDAYAITPRCQLAFSALARVQNLPPEAQGRHTLASFRHVGGAIAGDLGTIYLTDKTFGDDTRGFYAGTDSHPACPPSFRRQASLISQPVIRFSSSKMKWAIFKRFSS